ncbi:TIGR04222 domain-containing membrane protein [Kitasatospora sp. NPDC051170]|uniref:TIGR04222 domain-containing membrane protein n=1 Tax=Kitasatospora sp. NPDC051170 TaxID=3364056 RepID=UPI003787E61C
MWVVLVLLAAAVAMVVVAAVLCHVRLRTLRRAERLAAGREFDLTRIELALLAGKLGELIVTEMYEAGRLVAARSGDVTLTTTAAVGAGAEDGAGGGFEAAVVRLLGSERTGDLWTLRMALDKSPEVKALRERLAAQGLAYDEELVERAMRVNRLMPTLIGTVFVTGVAAVYWTGAHRGLWPFPLEVSALAAFLLPLGAALWLNHVSWPTTLTPTGSGERALEAARAAAPRHGTAAVALRGLRALPDDHDLRACHAGTGARLTARVEESMRRRLYSCGSGCGE